MSTAKKESDSGKFFAFSPEKEGQRVVLEDPASRRAFALARSVAETPSTVLLSGESGAGKEVFARFIHEHSPRAEDAFVGVNCAAFSESLLESELFGHEKGAFSGAVKLRAGVFERAHGGTLLLDEISEMPLDLQAKLLRVIQQRGFYRVGGSKLIEVDVRIIATTNRDLKQYVKQGGFRHDLYYRLNVFPIQVPALRERRQDIAPLALYYGAQLAQRCGRSIRGIAPAAMARLESYRFSGNVRELVNVLERAVILCGNEELIQVEHLILDDAPSITIELRDDFAEGLIESTQVDSDEWFAEENEKDQVLEFRPGEQALTDVRKELILATLKRFDGNQKKAAEALGITARTIRNKLKDYEERDS